jgi:DNA helicase-2/ATP-dependent DNA helicase PcrA
MAPGATLGEISKAKNNLWTPDEYEERHPSFIGERYAQVYREYERRLGESNGLDFDDLIMRTIQLLERDETARNHYQSKFRYVLVDEYQDVNFAQYKLVSLFAAKYKNLTVVGDDDQSIYSWRGSDYRKIFRARKYSSSKRTTGRRKRSWPRQTSWSSTTRPAPRRRSSRTARPASP